MYQSRRFGQSFSYAIPGLLPPATYTVRLHFAETVFAAAGQRQFSVSGNGSQLLSKLDVFAAAGGANKALVEQATVQSDANGVITLTFTGNTNNAMVSGIEVGNFS